VDDKNGVQFAVSDIKAARLMRSSPRTAITVPSAGPIFTPRRVVNQGSIPPAAARS